MLPGSPAPFQERFVRCGSALKVTFSCGNASESVQRIDHQQDFTYCFVASNARKGRRLGLVETPERRHIPADQHVVGGEQPPVLKRPEQHLRLCHVMCTV